MIKDPDRHIRKVLRVKRHDSPPYTGWFKARRKDLAQIYADLGYTTGAEIGVRIGSYSEVLCQTIPEIKLLCVDNWLAYGRLTQEAADKNYERAIERLAPYDVTFMRATSIEAAPEIPDESLDFVYIDASHDFDSVMVDIILWAKKVRKGGAVSGHDYFEFYRAGVVSAVRAYTQAHGIVNWYLTKEKEASWMWIKK